MFSRVVALAAIALTLTSQVQAHAAIAPALGVAGAPKRSDVQRPSTASPCGNVNIASTIDTSTPVVAAADGTFTVTVTDFNAGGDGSRSVSMTVDAAGTGKNFVAGTVSKNGNAKPTTVGSDQVTAALPAGTKCTGGKAGDLCVASFKTTAGFGNCVVVKQGGAAAPANAGTNASGTAVSSAAASTKTAATGTKAATGNKNANTGSKNADGAAKAGANSTATASASSASASASGKGHKHCEKHAKEMQAKLDELKAAFAKTGGTRAPRAFRELELALRELEESD